MEDAPQKLSTPRITKPPKNASQFNCEELRLSYFLTALKSHCHISAFQGSFPSTSGMLYAGIIPAGKQKPLPCTGPPWENLPSFAPLPKGHSALCDSNLVMQCMILFHPASWTKSDLPRFKLPNISETFWVIRFADLTLKSAKFISESHKGSVVKLKANCLEGAKVVFFCKLERLKSGTFLEVFFLALFISIATQIRSLHNTLTCAGLDLFNFKICNKNIQFLLSQDLSEYKISSQRSGYQGWFLSTAPEHLRGFLPSFFRSPKVQSGSLGSLGFPNHRSHPYSSPKTWYLSTGCWTPKVNILDKKPILFISSSSEFCCPVLLLSYAESCPEVSLEFTLEKEHKLGEKISSLKGSLTEHQQHQQQSIKGKRLTQRHEL